MSDEDASDAPLNAEYLEYLKLKNWQGDFCPICNNPVVPGEPVHGMTGAHWECHTNGGKEGA